MKKRKRCQNKECGVLFTPCPQVPGQTYCSRPACRQARKNKWNREKYAVDSDYREARQAAQQRMKEKKPAYWREYRARHPKYTQQNRAQQRLRNQNRSKKPLVSVIANPDESIPVNPLITGRYKIIPIHSDVIVNPDECIVEITAITG